MTHTFYSIRTGINKNLKGLSLDDLKTTFTRLYSNLRAEGYFEENFGGFCVDDGNVPGKIADIELEISLKLRKNGLWPIEKKMNKYSEDDVLDMIEFLYLYVSKPIEGHYHSYGDCGMHWETFNKVEGQEIYREKVNELLSAYQSPFELSVKGEILQKPEKGLEKIFEADIPSSDTNITSRIDAAVLKFRRHGVTRDDRRHAVRDLADILEYLRPKVKDLLTSQDEKDLFNIANNFGIRHHNDKQKTDYDADLWLSWMFYFYLSTIHVLTRKINKENSTTQQV